MVASTTSATSTTSAPITFSGLASGVDTDSIVQKLIAADQQPITNLQNAETAATNKLTAFGQINTLLTTLQTSVGAMNLTSEVRTTTASVSSGGPFTATSNNAYTGSYNISVSQLAQVQKDITTGFSSNSGSVLGNGRVTIGSQVITVDSSNNSLQGLMEAINKASGSTGVTASIINDGSKTSPYHLILTGKDASTNFTVSSSLASNGNTISLGTEVTETAGFSSATADVLGPGSITINGTPISSGSKTLQDLVKAINDTGISGITASIYNDGSSTNPYHLVITGPDSSNPPSVTSTLTDTSGNAISFNKADTVQTVQNAQQAMLSIDGINVVSNSNTVTGAITGVTLNLNAISAISVPGTPPQYLTSQLSITPDTTTLEKNINTFVTNYNAIMNWINAGYSLASSSASSTTTPTDPSTATNPTDAQLSQILIGDSTIGGIKSRLQTMLSGSVNSSSSSGALNNLSQIGISTNLDGTLTVDTPTLESSLSNNFNGVTSLLAGDGTHTGVMQQFNTYLLNQTSITQGMYAQKKTITQTKLNDLDNQITQKTTALNKEEATMKARFAAMETIVSSLNTQSSFLTQWISSYTGQTSSSSKS